MARSVANVVVSTDTFANWIGKTNQLADAMSVYTVTVDSTANGANVSGNGFVVGILQANTLAAGDVLRGGSVNASANLNITSNTRFTGAEASAMAATALLWSRAGAASNCTEVSG